MASLTPEQAKAMLQEVRAERARRAAGGQAQAGAAQPQAATPTGSGTFLGDMLNKIDPRLTNAVFSGLRSAASGKVEGPVEMPKTDPYQMALLKAALGERSEEAEFERDTKAYEAATGGGQLTTQAPSQPVAQPVIEAASNEPQIQRTNPVNAPSEPSSDIPQFIQKPGVQEYDPKLRRMVTKPGGYVINPEYTKKNQVSASQDKKAGEFKAKQADFKQALEAFKAVESQIPRKYGADRFVQGAKNIYARTMQEEGDTLGSVSSAFEGARKNLRVAVARIKDVGNLSETEQKAAEQLVTTDMDNPETAKLKNAYLEALAGATSPDEIKSLVQSFMRDSGSAPIATEDSQFGQEVGIQVFKSPEEADNSGLPPGTIVSVGNRRYEIG